MLRLEALTKQFGTKTAVSAVTLDIPKGQFVGVIGRSGAGKSTLLRMINRLAEPTGGRIIFDGKDVTRLRGQGLRDWRQQSAMIFQQFNLVGRLDVLTNVLMGRLNHTGTLRALASAWTREDRAIALSALEQLDIASLAAQRADTLSGGQQQRVAIARALAMKPDLVLADEPTGNLDSKSAADVFALMRRMNEQVGTSFLIVTHNMDLARRCDRIIEVIDGRVSKG